MRNRNLYFAKIESIEGKLKALQMMVKMGQPVRIEILAKEDGTGCMGTVMIPGIIDNPKYFKKGELDLNVF